MKWKMFLCAACTALALTVSAAAADLFPMPKTQLDGETEWGYMDASGQTQVDAFYAEAGVFQDCGLAVVKDVQGRTGLIDSTGKLVVPCQESPKSVDFSDDMVAFRYSNRSEYFTFDGTVVGTYAGAAGFFSEEGLLRVQKNGKWGYVDKSGKFVIDPAFLQAGDFSGGYALVQRADGTYGYLLPGATFTPLPAKPDTFAVQDGSLAVLRTDDGCALYSLPQGHYLTKPVYDSIGTFHQGTAIVQKGTMIGLLNASGKEALYPQYHYLSYMGSGVYAIRNDSGACMAIDGSGTKVYAMDGYTGGFVPFVFGLSWHNTSDGGIVFFSDSGAYCGRVKTADTAEIVGKNVAKVTTGTSVCYIRISDGKTLYTPERTYKLDDMTISTTEYQKYLGTAQDGTEYGWDLQYPQLSGMKNRTLQEKLNSAIEGFFLDGPSTEAQKLSLNGGYGVTFCGRLMVVSANAVSGLGTGSTLWNSSLWLDLDTGAAYQLTPDLLKSGYEQTLKALLPSSNAFYLYTAPRVTADGLVFYVTHPQTATREAYADSYLISYDRLGDALNDTGACYKAITASSQTAGTTAAADSFSDVPRSSWAYPYIKAVSEKGWMQGKGQRFDPSGGIKMSEAVTALSRALNLSGGSTEGVDASAWYADAYGSAAEAGLLEGLTQTDPESVMTRGEAMTLLANVAPQTLTDEQTETLLAPFADAAQLSGAQRKAAAACVQKKIIAGQDGRLMPEASVTRAQFAKLLCQTITD